MCNIPSDACHEVAIHKCKDITMCATVKTGTPGQSVTSHVLICSYQVEFNDLVSATPRVSRVSPALSLAVTPRDLDQ